MANLVLKQDADKKLERLNFIVHFLVICCGNVGKSCFIMFSDLLGLLKSVF